MIKVKTCPTIVSIYDKNTNELLAEFDAVEMNLNDKIYYWTKEEKPSDDLENKNVE